MLSQNELHQVKSYSDPREFIFRNEEYDCIISEWYFEGMNLGHFLAKIDHDKLLILTCGKIRRKPKCQAVLNKLYDIERLVELLALIRGY